MAKRLCPFDENIQAVKKQIGNGKAREIRSTLSEKTLQLLYKGASQQLHPEAFKQEFVGYFKCSQCLAPLAVNTKCFYCDKFICDACTNICTRCDEEYCKDCSFVNYDKCESICYSCY